MVKCVQAADDMWFFFKFITVYCCFIRNRLYITATLWLMATFVAGLSDGVGVLDINNWSEITFILLDKTDIGCLEDIICSWKKGDKSQYMLLQKLNILSWVRYCDSIVSCGCVVFTSSTFNPDFLRWMLIFCQHLAACSSSLSFKEELAFRLA